MSITEVDRIASSVAVTSLGTRTSNFTLPQGAPTVNNWLFVALYTNYGNIPAGTVSGQVAKVNSVKVGTLDLALIESPPVTSQYAPTLYGVPINASNSSSVTATIAVNWQNITSATMSLFICASLFVGGDTTNNIGFAGFRLPSGTGEFDSAGGNTFGAVTTQASNGLITWPNSTGITLNYDQSLQPFVAAFFSTSGAAVNVFKQFGFLGAGVDGSGNVSTYGFATGQVQLSSGATGFATSGKAVVYSNYGNIVISYTGVTTSPSQTLTGCTTTAPAGITFSGYEFISLSPFATTATTAVLASSSPTSGTLYGVTNGNNASGAGNTNGTIQIAVSGGSLNGRLDLHVGRLAAQNYGYLAGQRQYSIPAYGHFRIHGTNLANGGGSIYFLVPRYRTMGRWSIGSQFNNSFVARTITRGRTAIANRSSRITTTRSYAAVRRSVTTGYRKILAPRLVAIQRRANANQVNLARITKTRSYGRLTNVTISYAISTSKTRTTVRRAIATMTGIARAIGVATYLSHAGKVEGDFKIAGGRGAFVTADVDATFETANVVGRHLRIET